MNTFATELRHEFRKHDWRRSVQLKPTVFYRGPNCKRSSGMLADLRVTVERCLVRFSLLHWLVSFSLDVDVCVYYVSFYFVREAAAIVFHFSPRVYALYTLT